MLGKILALVTSSMWFGESASIRGAAIRTADDYNAPLNYPPEQVSIQIPGYREPLETMEETLKSLRNQNIVSAYPERFEYVFLGSAGDDTLEGSLPTIRNYVDRVLIAPRRGKLLARDMGARNTMAPVLASVDADSYYGPNYLNAILSPYATDPFTVATMGYTVRPIDYVLGPLVLAYHTGFLEGRCSTFKRDAYFETGGFDFSAEEYSQGTTDIYKIWAEEELAFKRRMNRAGHVHFLNVAVRHFYDVSGKRGLHARRLLYESG